MSCRGAIPPTASAAASGLARGARTSIQRIEHARAPQSIRELERRKEREREEEREKRERAKHREAEQEAHAERKDQPVEP